MNIREAVASRFSCRAFLPTPVPQSIVRDILELSARAPSGSNLQPWFVHVLAGDSLAALKKSLEPRYGELPRGDGPGYEVFPGKLHEPYRARRFDVGLQLYDSLGIPYEDREARLKQYARNLIFFNAPVALFFVIDRALNPAQWADLGMFVQTVMLIARDYDLHTCAQQAWVPWSKTVEQFLKLPPDRMLFCGMALGHADESAPENKWRSPREPVENWATFSGF
jgi:nitroreductase